MYIYVLKPLGYVGWKLDQMTPTLGSEAQEQVKLVPESLAAAAKLVAQRLARRPCEVAAKSQVNLRS
jgi:hypothetical protein